MNYISTRNKSVKIAPSAAVLRGLAPDGGLYVPEAIPDAELSKEQLLGFSYPELVTHILTKLLPDLGQDNIMKAVTQGYGGKFETEDIIPMKNLKDKSVLELYHGPTSAFKDMALCLLPGLITNACKVQGFDKEVLILTATSGDTGKAALAGFAGAPNTKIIVFYPESGVSPVQKAQMVTQEGENVCVCAVDGNFDDAQTGVKNAFSEVKNENIYLSSANSINIGRLAPQVAYYFGAYARLVKSGRIKYGDSVSFAVPTGNFGNILAGYIAKKMGLFVDKFICASNANNVLTDFLTTGVYDRNRPFYLTASPSMDILISSNFERLLFFMSGGDDRLVSSLMERLASTGRYEVPADLLKKIQSEFLCGWADDDACFKEIRGTFKDENYLIDPHTAVAFAVCEDLKKRGALPANLIILSTASPYKFAASMLKALGAGIPEDGFDAMDSLKAITGRPIPSNLDGLRYKKVLHSDVVSPKDITKFVERKAGERIWAK